MSSGYYLMDWDANNYVSGIYLLQFKSEKFIVVKGKLSLTTQYPFLDNFVFIYM